MTTIDALLTTWLPDQRWFAGKGRAIEGIGIRRLELPDPGPATDGGSPAPRLFWVFADVRYAEGEAETYSIPVTVREPGDRVHPEIVIGHVDATHGTKMVCDALRDRDSSPAWLRLLSSQRSVEDENGARIEFSALDPDAVPADLVGDLVSTEQSNSSVIYGDQLIVKFFRRVEPGINPDVEIHTALAPAENPHIAPLRGSVALRDSGGVAGADSTLAIAQQFLATASDGFSLALTSMRDLLGDLSRDPARAGGDFASEAFRLGHATARVHADLATVLPTTSYRAEDLARLAGEMSARLGLALSVVPELGPYADGLRARYDALAGLGHDVPSQRVHGDFHLGQTMRTTHGWVILDFEGEPIKPLSQRIEPDTPIRDVAGMLRSLDYASRALLVEESGLGGDVAPTLDNEGAEVLSREERAAQWRARNIDAFCNGYAEASGSDPREQSALLSAFLADKAVYEALYEARNRPHWLRVPLQALQELAEPQADGVPEPEPEPGPDEEQGAPVPTGEGMSQAELTGSWGIIPAPADEADGPSQEAPQDQGGHR